MKDFTNEQFPNDYELHFVTPCEHREVIVFKRDRDGKIIDHANVCALLTAATGMSTRLDAVTCANCRLTGEPNKDMLKNIATRRLLGATNMAGLGMLRTVDRIVSVFESALVLIDASKRTESKVDDHLFNCVLYGWLPHEIAVSLAKKHYPTEHQIHNRLLSIKHSKTVVHFVDEKTQDLRHLTCVGCPMLHDGAVPTCGAPLKEGETRDTAKDGHGEDLRVKWQLQGEKCPQGKW